MSLKQYLAGLGWGLLVPPSVAVIMALTTSLATAQDDPDTPELPLLPPVPAASATPGSPDAPRPTPPRPACRFESVIQKAPPAGLVSLTFDDGPQPGATEQILALLDRYRIPATFFLIGSKVQKNPQLTAQLRAHSGVQIGNHSWSHADFHRIGEARQLDELKRTDAVLDLKDDGPKFFRYPYGNASCGSKSRLHEWGYHVVGWHVDSCDWGFDRTGSVSERAAQRCRVDPEHRDQFVEHVVSAVKARNGGIVLMHESHANTLAQLDEIIRRLLAEGFQFAPLTHPGFQTALR